MSRASHNAPCVVVVGAGAAGLSAALELDRRGAAVTLIDRQATVGGQGLRGHKKAARLGDSVKATRVRHLSLAQWWHADHPQQLLVCHNNITERIDCDHLIIATGAMERSVPIPGWQLPGVMNAGALQILLKSSPVRPSAPPLLAGNGPLLYRLAMQLLDHGIKPMGIVDTSRADCRRAAYGKLPGAAFSPGLLLQGLAWKLRLKRARIPVWLGAELLEFAGSDRVNGVRFRHAGREQWLPTSLVLTHYGVIPDTQPSELLGLGMRWREAQQSWAPDTDLWGRSSVRHVSVVGDAAGIAGVESAQSQGALAALDVAAQLGLSGPGRQSWQAWLHRWNRFRYRRSRAFLDAYFRLGDEQLQPPDTALVCRCECVSAREIRDAAAQGAMGPNQVKAFTRCGMGPCQGRQCGDILEGMVARAWGCSREQIGRLRTRPPLMPVSLATIASAVAPDSKEEHAS